MTDVELSTLVRNVAAARDELTAAERESRRKRGDYHAAIGELSQAGLTVREIGKAIDLSHQRVQQILEGLVCSFCQEPASDVQKLLAGGGESRPYICDACVGRGTQALRTKEPVVEDGAVMSFTVTTQKPCDFCARHIGDRVEGRSVTAMVTSNRTWICRLCVKACADILETEWSKAL